MAETASPLGAQKSQPPITSQPVKFFRFRWTEFSSLGTLAHVPHGGNCKSIGSSELTAAHHQPANAVFWFRRTEFSFFMHANTCSRESFKKKLSLKGPFSKGSLQLLCCLGVHVIFLCSPGQQGSGGGGILGLWTHCPATEFA